MSGLYETVRSVVWGAIVIVVLLGVIGLWFAACEGGV